MSPPPLIATAATNFRYKMDPSITSPEPSPPATTLPLELVEMVIAHLIYDMPSLLACSLTSHSWYIAAVPHLHHDLSIDNWETLKISSSNPLKEKHKFGLIPFVKTLRIGRLGAPAFTPEWLDGCILDKISALNNLQRLVIDHFNIPGFMPQIRQFFAHFSSTIRELCLMYPTGSRQQILFFVGLFEHLEDLSIINYGFEPLGEPPDDSTPVPPFTPPLRGWLKLSDLRQESLLKDMVDLFGGLRFRQMDLSNVYGISFLLNACANTLETLRLDPVDSDSESFSPKAIHTSTDGSQVSYYPTHPLNFDLSPSKSLRTLQIQALSPSPGSLDVFSNFLNHALSAITSPGLFQVVVIYSLSDFHHEELWPGYQHWPPVREMSRTQEVSWHRMLLGAIRGVHRIQGLRLELRAEVLYIDGEYSVGILKDAVAEEKATGGFDGVLSEPLVTFHPQTRPE